MKILLSCLTAFLFLTASAQTDSASEVAKFTTTTHSFGKIKQHVPATTEFTFTNTGAKPLIIETAVAECGCTTPEYPKTPIIKGKNGTIKVTYNAESPGKFTKRVTVKFANIAQPVILTIDGEVETSRR
jgi:autotransporter adhesin